MVKKSALGRGLGALIDTDDIYTSGSSSISEVDVDLIFPNPNQPRSHFDEESLAELASSIRELGVISPITLRKNDDGTYLIIAGERRYRASKMLGLKSIPAYVKTAADEQVVEMALIENIQREDLNAIEVALAFYRLLEEYHLTQEQLSERVGKKRATIANYLRLLRLPAEIQVGIKDKKIDMGHARAILGLEDPAVQLQLYEAILENFYSVRKVEEMVRLYAETGSFEEKHVRVSKPNPIRKLKEYEELKNQLSKTFGTKVQFSCNEQGKGKISIPFSNDEELSRIMGLLDKI
ncbi:MAG TPA: ParB/RepB/Spo0J family partition protein [Paludibacteraceae bacterium]|nr:ParB/RepB/Spo0J family partition protein [Paludibacteraceae bacterium]HON02172.1 ParB/RepB/Spo0J family partition protein [Paludibacteraceae bacterium]HPQ12294.1 ParB/RepB/Spo0J family partition protein [Paludibacteraceae bacterium]HRS24013.1 ParB/RepB/Spo0J family partition protein [Paludibacteraceae bacterium]HRT78098.1 ParB/RepB/Spo0J family partition protein [Paludibacteraceae bacterium]